MKHVLVAALAVHLLACSSAANDSGRGGSGGAAGTAGTGGSGATAGTGATGGSGGGTGGSGATAGTGATGGSGGGGGTGGSGATAGTGATGGSGGGGGTCGPGDLDCLCPGGTFECLNNRLACVCPQQCTTSDQCGQDAICFFYDGNCGGGTSGYCLPLAKPRPVACNQKPSCGCDGNLYDDGCAAIAAHVSPSAAATSDCSAKPLPCTDSPSGVSCFPNQYCMAWSTAGTVSAACLRFNTSCAQPSCDCLSYNAQTCSCALLPSGIVKLTCNI